VILSDVKQIAVLTKTAEVYSWDPTTAQVEKRETGIKKMLKSNQYWDGQLFLRRTSSKNVTILKPGGNSKNFQLQNDSIVDVSYNFALTKKGYIIDIEKSDGERIFVVPKDGGESVKFNPEEPNQNLFQNIKYIFQSRLTSLYRIIVIDQNNMGYYIWRIYPRQMPAPKDSYKIQEIGYIKALFFSNICDAFQNDKNEVRVYNSWRMKKLYKFTNVKHIFPLDYGFIFYKFDGTMETFGKVNTYDMELALDKIRLLFWRQVYTNHARKLKFLIDTQIYM
jgi:hypothetical protein